MSPHSNPLITKLQAIHPLTPEEERFIDGICSRVVPFGPDEDIVTEGDQPSDSNLLLDGFVCRYKLLQDGRRQIVAFHCPGDVFDAQSFLLETMDHSIATLTNCKIAMIPHPRLVEITESHPRIARALWKDTLIDAAIFREWMTSIGRRSAYQRIAHLMCEMFVKMEIVRLTDGQACPWPITQAEVGDALGLSLVHVNRTLQELRAAGLITLKDGRLVIHDWEGLKEAGDFDAGYLHLEAPKSSMRAGARHQSGSSAT